MRIILFGSGKVASMIYEEIKDEELIVVDNDRKKWGELWNGHRIKDPSILKEVFFDKVIIAIGKFEDVRQQLLEEFHISEDKIDNIYFRQREQFLSHYQKEYKTLDCEAKSCVEYVKRNPLSVFNYEFVNKYQHLQEKVFYDEQNQLFYVIYKQKRMYFSKKYDSEEKVKRYYSAILMEQDEKSPHRYLSDEFHVDQGNIVLDAGVAEGNFSLDIIDYVKKIYLVEADEDWIEALQYTFAPYMEKVKIIHGYLGYGKGEISIDDIIGEEHLDFLKMDIEGAELSALKGASRVLKRENVKVDICTYHKEDDYQHIQQELEKYQYRCKNTEGYMVFIHNENFKSIVKPVLVRGLIQGKKDMAH